jgi:hypothetical protein
MKSRKKSAVVSRKYRKRNRKHNRCTHCRAEAVAGKTLCAYHCAYYTAQSAKHRAETAPPKFFVAYGLGDPREEGVKIAKYVGSTQNLEARIRSHYAERATRNTPLSRWLLELEAEGMEPLITIHQHCYTRAGAEKAEGEWIRIMRRLGAELFNQNVPTGNRTETRRAQLREMYREEEAQ